MKEDPTTGDLSYDEAAVLWYQKELGDTSADLNAARERIAKMELQLETEKAGPLMEQIAELSTALETEVNRNNRLEETQINFKWWEQDAREYSRAYSLLRDTIYGILDDDNNNNGRLLLIRQAIVDVEKGRSFPHYPGETERYAEEYRKQARPLIYQQALEDLADFIAVLWDGLERGQYNTAYVISPNTKARVDGLIAAISTVGVAREKGER